VPEDRSIPHVRMVQPPGTSYTEALRIALEAVPEAFRKQHAVLVHGMRVVAHSLDDADQPAARLAHEWRLYCQRWESALSRYLAPESGESVGDVVAARVQGLRAVQ